jgi:hypothetical protein
LHVAGTGDSKEVAIGMLTPITDEEFLSRWAGK